MEKAKQFLESAVSALVKNAESVRVESFVDEMGVLLTLHVAKEDMGFVIGKGGAIVNALRLLVRSIGVKENARVSLKVAEPEGSQF